MSWRTISILELDNTIPVSPPNVNRKIKPIVHQIGGLRKIFDPKIVLIHLNTLIPVGIAMIIVAAVK